MLHSGNFKFFDLRNVIGLGCLRCYFCLLFRFKFASKSKQIKVCKNMFLANLTTISLNGNPPLRPFFICIHEDRFERWKDLTWLFWPLNTKLPKWNASFMEQCKQLLCLSQWNKNNNQSQSLKKRPGYDGISVFRLSFRAQGADLEKAGSEFQVITKKTLWFLKIIFFFYIFKIEEERLPQFRNLMKTMEEQIENVLKMIAEMNEDGKTKQKSLDVSLNNRGLHYRVTHIIKL